MYKPNQISENGFRLQMQFNELFEVAIVSGKVKQVEMFPSVDFQGFRFAVNNFA
jgi:hypothetical protein